MARYAAIDIGSNSVRMLAAEVTSGNGTRVIASDREVTRLGASVFQTGRVSSDAIELVSSVLRRMREAYSKLDVLAVRAVATSAIRDASNQAEFVERASAAIDAPVEIISGQEEARLIHLGLQSRWPHPEERILVIDVGGGSAEFIVGEQGELQEGISRPLGAVRLTEVFLQSDPPTDLQLLRMAKFIDEKFERVLRRIGSREFHRVIGTSATAAAIVGAVNGVPRSERESADRMRAGFDQVRRLFGDLAKQGASARRKIPGIGPKRAEIIVAGAAVFVRVLEALGCDSLHYSVAGVRDGIIADLNARGIGRELSRIPRTQIREIESMCRKYGVNVKYARQVAGFAGSLFDALEPLHRLPPDRGRLLQTAAYLHDTGHFISDTGHHKHSAYVVWNSDLPGYTDAERQLISLLCRYHRKSLPAARHDIFRQLSSDEKRTVQMLTPLLRIAIALDASKEQRIGAFDCQIENGGVALNVASDREIDLEVWAVERAADAFRQMYGLVMTVSQARQ